MFYNETRNLFILNGEEMESPKLTEVLTDEGKNFATWSVNGAFNGYADDLFNGSCAECVRFAREYAEDAGIPESEIHIVLIALNRDGSMDVAIEDITLDEFERDDEEETFRAMVEEYLADRPELTEGDDALTVIEYYQDEDDGEWRALAEDEKTNYELRAVGDEIVIEYTGTK